MPRLPSIKLAALNVVLQPHTPERYVKLWNALFNLHMPIPYRGDQSVMLGRVEPIDPNDLTLGFSGLIFRFTTIDTNKPWFDIDDGTEADPATVQKEVRIPQHLCPNLSTFGYRFFPRGHRLIIERQNEKGDVLSPGAIEKLLNHLTAKPEIQHEFQNIDITVEQEKEAIARILRSHTLKELVITVKRPNPDDDADADEQSVFGEMEEEHVRKKTVSISALRHQSIKPNAKTKRFARVARSNGKVEAIEETDDGVRVKSSSRDHPNIATKRYDPERQSRFDAFLDLAKGFIDTLVS